MAEESRGGWNAGCGGAYTTLNCADAASVVSDIQNTKRRSCVSESSSSAIALPLVPPEFAGCRQLQNEGRRATWGCGEVAGVLLRRCFGDRRIDNAAALMMCTILSAALLATPTDAPSTAHRHLHVVTRCRLAVPAMCKPDSTTAAAPPTTLLPRCEDTTSRYHQGR